MRFPSMNISRFIILCSVALLSAHMGAAAAVAAETDGLPVALRSAVSRNPAVIAKLEELKSLGYSVDSAEAGRYPVLTLQGQTMSDDQSQVLVKLQQPLWAGGRITGGIELAEVKLHSAQAALLQTRRQLMEDAAAAYAELLGVRQRLAVADLNVAEHEKLLALITRRQTGNIASEADVRLARSRLAQAQTQQVQLRGTVEKARSELFAITQVSLDGVTEIAGGLLELPDSAGILRDAESSSATVRLRQIDVNIARTQADLRESDMMPTLSAVVERDIVRATSYGTLSPDTRIGVVLSGTLEGVGFAGFRRVKSAEAMVDAARREVETARNDLLRRTRGFISDLDMYRKVIEVNNLLVISTQETLTSFMRQYDAGRKSWVDVLNAQKELADARQSMEQTKISATELSLRLGVITGRLDKYAGILP